MNTDSIKIFLGIVVIAAIIALIGLGFMIFSEGFTWLNIGATILTLVAFFFLGRWIYRKLDY